MDTKLTPINVFDAALADLQLETEQLSKKWEVIRNTLTSEYVYTSCVYESLELTSKYI
jgi:hypothetical protein